MCGDVSHSIASLILPRVSVVSIYIYIEPYHTNEYYFSFIGSCFKKLRYCTSMARVLVKILLLEGGTSRRSWAPYTAARDAAHQGRAARGP